MSSERDDVTKGTPQPGEQPSAEQKSDPPIKPKSGKSVAIYLVILFAAAFILLLMAYFQQQRSSDQLIGNLQNSVSQFQTVDELREENRKLQEQLEEYEALIEELISIGLLTRGEGGDILPVSVIDVDELAANGGTITFSSGVTIPPLPTPSP